LTITRIPVTLLASELKLTEVQQAKITALRAQLEKDTTALRPAPGEQFNPDNRQKMQDLNTEATSKMTEVLTTDQQAQLPDVIKSLNAYPRLGIPLEVLPTLKLTADQKTKLTALADERQKAQQAKMQELQQNGGGDRTAMMQAFQDMQKETQTKVAALLTASQNSTLTAYNKEHPQNFGPGGRGGGGGGRRPGAAGGAGGNGPV
jgi:hypothetical protein